MSRPALSVVMPAYNAGPYIERAASSVLQQTFRDLELVIVNDGSTDDTGTIADSIASADDRVTVIHNEQNIGEAAAFNRGVAAAKAPVIGRMDADDISLPHRFETQVNELEADPGIAVLGAYASHTNDGEDVLSLSETGPATTAEFQAMRDRGDPTMVFGGTAVFRRELFDLVGGYDQTLSTAADLDFCDRMADHGVIRAVPEPLLLYRVHNNSNVMRRFFDGRKTHRYVWARRRAARNGEKTLTRAEYLAWERSQSAWWRFRTWQGDVAQYHYRSAGIAFANGRRLPMLLRLAIAVIADPSHVLKRLWNQRLGPAARRARRDGSFAEDSLR